MDWASFGLGLGAGVVLGMGLLVGVLMGLMAAYEYARRQE